MKTIKKNGKIQRQGDIVARTMVQFQGWEYCPKSKWRKKVRDAEPFGTHKLVHVKTRFQGNRTQREEAK